MDIHELKVFLAVSETLNISHVAEQCYTSRQSIRYSVKKLEQELNAKLIDSSGNKLVLTPKGEELAPMVRTAIASLTQLHKDFTSGYAEDRQRLSIFVDPSLLAEGETVSKFLAFLTANSIENFRVSETPCDACASAVISHQADFGVARFDGTQLEGCDVDVFRVLNFSLIVNQDNPLAQNDSLSIEDFDGVPLLVRSGYETRYSNFLLYCKQYGIAPRTDMIINSARTASQLVEDGVGCILISSYDTEKRYLENGLVSLPFADKQLQWNDCLIARKNSSSATAASVIRTFFKEEKQAAIPAQLRSSNSDN